MQERMSALPTKADKHGALAQLRADSGLTSGVDGFHTIATTAPLAGHPGPKPVQVYWVQSW